MASCLLSLYKHCKELSQKSVSPVKRGYNYYTPELIIMQVSYGVPVDLSKFIDVQLTASPALKLSCPPAGKGSAIPCGAEGTSTQSSQEGGWKGRGSGDEVRTSGRRDAKRKLLDALDPFAPKRRSSRVSGSISVTEHSQEFLCPQVLTRRKDKDHKNYFEMLSKYLPSWLM